MDPGGACSLAGYLAAADLGICHLETPVAEPEGPFNGYPAFNVPPQILTAAVDVGYEACTTASNHTIDTGTEGLVQTLAALEAAGPELTAKARAARASGADVVLAALHAGDEYASAPNAQQVEVADALADSGEVDFIYGHHTHSVQPIEQYNGTWIAYGLGNGVTELSPVYDVNNEGLMVRPSFNRTMPVLGPCPHLRTERHSQRFGDQTGR